MAGFKQISKDNWEVNFFYRDYLGKNIRVRKRGFKTKKEAKLFSEDYISKMNGRSDILFKTAFEEFIEYKSKTYKKNTLLLLKYLYKNHINPYFSSLKLSEITEKIVLNFYNKFINNIPTYKVLRARLNTFYKYVKVQYNLTFNPFAISLDLPQQAKAKPEIWTLEEFKLFDSYINYERSKVYYNLLYFSGARSGEIAALTLKDIDFENNTISINKTRLNLFETNSPKTASSIRKITIPIPVMNMLKTFISKYTVVPKFIFTTTTTYKKELIKICKENNLKYITLHGFRHSHASFLIKNGMDIASISKRLGHSNINMTLTTYAHFYDNKKDEILDFLNSCLE